MITSSLSLFSKGLNRLKSKFSFECCNPFKKKSISPLKIGRHMWMAPKVKTYLTSPFKMLQKQVNMGGVILK